MTRSGDPIPGDLSSACLRLASGTVLRGADAVQAFMALLEQRDDRRLAEVGAWEEEEDAVIGASPSAATAVVDYRVARPAGIRTAGAVKSRWYYLQKKGQKPAAQADGGDDPLPLHTRVRILLEGSKYSGYEGEIVRQTQRSDEYVVAPDGSFARVPVLRKDLEVLP